MEKLPDDAAAKRTVQENLKTLRQLDLVDLDGHGRGARWSLGQPQSVDD